jgi:hypothetical protein
LKKIWKKFISNDISLKMEIEFDDNFKKFNLEKDLFEKEKLILIWKNHLY